MRSEKEINEFDENLFIPRRTFHYGIIRNISNNQSIFKCLGEPVGNGFVTSALSFVVAQTLEDANDKRLLRKMLSYF